MIPIEETAENLRRILLYSYYTSIFSKIQRRKKFFLQKEMKYYI